MNLWNCRAQQYNSAKLLILTIMRPLLLIAKQNFQKYKQMETTIRENDIDEFPNYQILIVTQLVKDI